MSGTEPGGTRAGPDRGPARYSVPQIARLLGISERAVRKRIAAGTLQAERDGARWWVLMAEPIAEPGGTDRGTEAEPEPEPIEADHRPRLAPGEQRQIEAIREGLLAPLIDHNAQLVERIGELEREAGRLAAERDALRDRLDALEGSQAPKPAAQAPQHVHERHDAQRPSWRVWRRFRR